MDIPIVSKEVFDTTVGKRAIRTGTSVPDKPGN
jgi:hypothetical protein